MVCKQANQIEALWELLSIAKNILAEDNKKAKKDLTDLNCLTGLNCMIILELYDMNTGGLVSV